MGRAARVVLRRADLPLFRHRGRIRGGPRGAGGSPARGCVGGAGCLPRHPDITAHRAVHVAGQVEGRTVLVQGGAGAVGAWAMQLAHRAGARVIATCREAGLDPSR